MTTYFTPYVSRYVLTLVRCILASWQNFRGPGRPGRSVEMSELLAAAHFRLFPPQPSVAPSHKLTATQRTAQRLRPISQPINPPTSRPVTIRPVTDDSGYFLTVPVQSSARSSAVLRPRLR